MQQNSSSAPPIVKIASMLGITLLNEDAVKLLHILESIKVAHYHAGVEAERKRCIKICEDNASSGEMWWDSAMGFVVEKLKETDNETK
jgi:hypothetical protein